jgi:aminoglycoside phosphotransferase (APT) family kinase protein
MASTATILDALRALAPRLRAGATGVAGLTRLTGGASQQTWRFEVTGPGAPETLILRRRAGGDTSPDSAAITLSIEAALLRLAAAQGVKVPPVRHVCVPEDGLGEAVIVGYVAGETLGRRIVGSPAFSDVRPALAAQAGTALARIHATNLAGAPTLPRMDAAETLAWYENVFHRSSACRPVLELAFRVLRRDRPPPVAPTLVHGDFRTGNLMIDPSIGLVAVLDWELAHIGDPAEDIGWLCVNSWRFGAVENRAGGFGSLDAVLEAYVAAGATPPTEARVSYWQMLGSLKWAVMCLTMYEIFRAGSDPSLERAAIGRRVSECEADLLALMEQAA